MSPVTHDLGWFSFFPRIVRLCTFKVAVLPESTWYERFFLPNRLCGTLTGFSLERAKKIIETMKTLGQEHWITPKDGEARLQTLMLHANEMREKIRSLGGSWEKMGSRIVIVCPEKASHEWSDYFSKLKVLFPNQTLIDGKQALVTCEKADAIPFFEGKAQCVLFAKLAKPYAMDKHEIAHFLGMGLDVCVYDTRGCIESQGYPSEAGIYHDIEAVGEFLFKKQEYEPKNTWIYGSCGESFISVHLFKKYHAQGINLFLSNSPLSLHRVIDRVNFIARWIFHFVKSWIQAAFRSKCDKSSEDYFDSERKMRSLGVCKGSRVILGSAIGDTTAPPEEVQQMAALLRERGCDVITIQNQEGEGVPEGISDPHLSNCMRNPRIQDDIHRHLFRADRDALQSLGSQPCR